MTDTYRLHLTSASLQDVTSAWNLVLKKSLCSNLCAALTFLSDFWEQNLLFPSVCRIDVKLKATLALTWWFSEPLKDVISALPVTLLGFLQPHAH